MNIKLAKNRGFCFGVKRAIEMVEDALDKYGKPVYVRHYIVHNEHVVDSLREKGAVFVESLDDIPDESIVIFSAHGVAPEVREKALQKKLKVIDATCPFVEKVHTEARDFHNKGYQVLLIGKKNHQEVIGIRGEAPVIVIENEGDIEGINLENKEKIVCLTQTTLSIDETKIIIQKLKEKFPKLITPSQEDVCQATRLRQSTVKKLADLTDLFLVIGSNRSNNSKKLVEIAKGANVKAFLISYVDDLNKISLKNIKNIGISSGASTPEILVKETIDYLQKKFPQLEVNEIS